MVSKVLKALRYVVMAPFVLIMGIGLAALLLWMLSVAIFLIVLPTAMTYSVSHGDPLTTLYGVIGSFFMFGFFLMIIGGVMGTGKGVGGGYRRTGSINTPPREPFIRRVTRRSPWDDGMYQRSGTSLT